MGNSIFLAKLIGPICIIVSLSLLLNRQSYQKITDDFLSNAYGNYIGAVLALIVGLLIINTHNVWEASWVVMITIIGWSGLIKGTWLLMFPGSVKKFVEGCRANTTLLKVQLGFTFIFGVFLTYKGYF